MVGSIGGSGGGAVSLSRYLTAGAAGSRAQSKAPFEADAQTGTKTGATGKPLTPSDQVLIDKLKSRDSDVKAHEGAHRAAAGPYGGAPSYTYQKGPDGANYAIGGEVSIDASPIAKDPNATITKELQIQRAALAPADPSSQDVKVAAEAGAMIAQAQASKAKGETGQAPDQTAPPINALVTRGLAAYGSAAGLIPHPRTSAGVSIHA